AAPAQRLGQDAHGERDRGDDLSALPPARIGEPGADLRGRDAARHSSRPDQPQARRPRVRRRDRACRPRDHGPVPRAGRDDAPGGHADQGLPAGAVAARRVLPRDGGARAEGARGPGPRARDRQDDRGVQRPARAAEGPAPAAAARLSGEGRPALVSAAARAVRYLKARWALMRSYAARISCVFCSASATIAGGIPRDSSLSGWCWFISRRYARFTSPSLAVALTPSTL